MEQIYDKKALEKVLYDFHVLTNQQVAIFDRRYELIAQYPPRRSPFCTRVRSAGGAARCDACDRECMRLAEEKDESVRYRCHAGLLEICTPIRDEQGVIGFFMLGQVLEEKDLDAQKDEIRVRAAGFFDEKGFERASQTIPVLSDGYIASVQNVIRICIEYICFKRMIHLTSGGLYGQIIYFIERRYNTDFTLQEMARELDVSVSALCKATQQHNTTVRALLRRKRIAEAKRLLAETPQNINAVALAVGVPDYNYFTRMFKKNEGMTPRAYRRSLR